MNSHPFSSEERRYEEPWNLVEEHRQRASQHAAAEARGRAFGLYVCSGELPSHFREVQPPPRDVIFSSPDPLPIVNPTVGVQSSPSANFHRLDSPSSTFDPYGLENGACSTPKQVIDRSRETFAYCEGPEFASVSATEFAETAWGQLCENHPGDRFKLPAPREGQLEVPVPPRFPPIVGRGVRKRSFRVDWASKFTNPRQADEILPPTSPSGNFRQPDARERRPVDLSDSGHLGQLEARLLQQQAYNASQLERIKTKDEAIANLEARVHALSKSFEAKSVENEQLLRELDKRGILEQESSIAYENQLKSLQATIEKLEGVREILKEENLALKASQRTWAEDKARIINQCNGYANTIFNLQKQNSALEEAQLDTQRDSIALGQLEAEIRHLTKDRDYLEAENRTLAKTIEELFSRNGASSQHSSQPGAAGMGLDRTDTLEMDVQKLDSQQKRLVQKHHGLQAQVKSLEAKVKGTSEAYRQLVNQADLLEPKRHKQQEIVNSLQDDIQQLLATKSELTKRKRELELEIGGLESSISKCQKSRRRPLLPNTFARPISRANSPGSSHSPSTPSSPGIKAKVAPGCEAAGLDEALASLFTSLALPEPKGGPTDNGDLEAQRRSARRRVDALEAAVDAFHKAVALLRQRIDGHVHLYPSTQPGLALQQADGAITKLDDLCQLLSNNACDFANLVQVEKRYFALQVENEALASEVEKLKMHHPTFSHEAGQLGEGLSRPLKARVLPPLALEEELARAQASANDYWMRLKTLERERNQLSLEYSRATQDLRYFTQELAAYRSELACSQEELAAAQGEIILYRQDIFRLEERLQSFKRVYPAPSGTVSPSPRSRGPCGPDELAAILESIRDAHKRQLTNLRTLLLGTSRGKLESAILDLQLELKELDLQATLALDRRASSFIEPSPSPKFSYSKPYKELCYQYRNEARYLRACLDREAGFKSDLVFQKRYLVMLVRWQATKPKDTFSLCPNPCLTALSPPSARHRDLSPSVCRGIDPTPSSSTRSKLRRCVWAILALVRAGATASQWAQATEAYRHQRAALTKLLTQKFVDG
ncbi:hypothetical protein L0F63_005032 [Massospora cicadina]|nr:hypothetical protein L0F63_005032 [Massospora cicadina]